MKYLYFFVMDKAGGDGTGNGGGAGGGSNQGGAQNADGGAGGGQSGGSGNDGGQGGGAGGSQAISKDDHDRALADLHRFKKAAKDNEDQVKSLQDQINQLKKSGLRATEDWKTLSEEQGKEIDELKKANENLKNGISKTFRSMQVRSEAKALGIREDALKDLDLLDFSSDVQVVFATDGTVSVEGAKAAAEVDAEKLESRHHVEKLVQLRLRVVRVRIRSIVGCVEHAFNESFAVRRNLNP